MKRTLLILLVLAGALVLLTPGCNTDDDAVTEKTGAVSLYVNTGVPPKASGGADKMNVTFSKFILYNSAGKDTVTLADAAHPLTIDFLEYRQGNLLEIFQVPPGTYNCLEMAIDSVSTVQGSNTCPAIDPDMTEPMVPACLKGPALVVKKDGSYTLTLKAPLHSIQCNKNGGTATVSIDDPTISLPG